MTKIQETLYILHKCHVNIQQVWDASQKHQQKGLISINHFTNNLAYYLILESVSFLEEYNKKFIPNNFDTVLKTRISITKKVAKPIHKRINTWDLKQFRNKIIAHPWRDKNKLTLPQNKKYNIPRSWFEFQILKDLIGYIHEIIRLEFEEEMDESLFLAETLKENIKSKTSIATANAETIRMQKEIEIIAKEFKKDLHLTLYIYKI